MSLAQVNTALNEIIGDERTLAENFATLVSQVRDVYTTIETKGGTVPANKNTENMASAIEGIE